MKVTVLAEHGHELALRGMSYSYKDRALDPDQWWVGQINKAERRAPLLAPKEGGHNKFLRSVVLWLDVEACRAWWSEFDTYQFLTKQSESTVHTLSKRAPTPEDFEEGTPRIVIDAFHVAWAECKGDITALKQALPEGFLQRRLVCLNYQSLREMEYQRRGHRLRWWNVFCDAVLAQVQRPEWITARDKAH